MCFTATLAQFASVLMWYNNESSCFLQQGKETQLLHVFEEDLIIGGTRTEDVQETPNSAHSGIYSRVFMQQCIILSSFGIEIMAPVNSSISVCCFLLVSSEPAFSARFFLVVVELTPTGRSLLHMWHLQLAARPVTLG